MTYTAYITDRETKESKVFTHEDESKKNFARNLRGNGYIVHFIATPETFEEESAKYHARLEDQRIKAAAKRSTARMCRAAEKAIAEAESLIAAINANKAEATEEPTTEEPATEEPTTEEPAADQEPEEETTENYVAWCGMIESDVITEEYETLSEAVDEVETRYNKYEMKAAGITFCRLLCNGISWLECLEEKTVDDVYYF